MHVRRPAITDRKIRFALVGCGRISANHIDALQRHAGRADLVAVCDNRPQALSAAVERTGAEGFDSLDALLAGIDADIVVLATPSGLHPQQAIRGWRFAAVDPGRLTRGVGAQRPARMPLPLPLRAAHRPDPSPA